LNRPVLQATDEERATGRLTGTDGLKIEALRILGATGQGWERAKPEDAGVEPGITYALANGHTVAVLLEPGMWAGAAKASPEQTVRSVVVSKGEPCWWFDERSPAVEVDPVTASEILARIIRLSA
jgi:hypothetical protein